jgi:DNA processing protein
LLAAFGLPGDIFVRPYHDIAAAAGKETAEAIAAISDPEPIENALAWSHEPGNCLVTLVDDAYPKSLLEITNPPLVLYVKGDPSLLRRPALAMVGARSATPQGIANAEAFAHALSEAGFVIVSGLASGIDAASHRGALAAGGFTVAVIATGADRIYPASNAALAREIASQGTIISEFPLGTPPRRHNFPHRNRLIAGLTRGVLIVEAALGSGSLITARLAAEAGREVFAIPGSIHSPLARGCHQLIRQGAKLVETVEDVLEEIVSRPAPNPPATFPETTRRPGPRRARGTSAAAPKDPLPPPTPPSPEAALVLEALGAETKDIDTLAIATGLTVEALYAILLTLELEGSIARLVGGRFQRLHTS